MGVNLAWVAVKGASEIDVNQYFSIEATEALEQSPRSEITRIVPNDEWQVYVFTDINNPLLSADDLKGLSYYGEVICVLVFENLMLSQVTKFVENKLHWEIKWAEQSLKCIGEDKEELAMLIDRIAGCEFEGPIVIANDIVGYKHNYRYQASYVVMEEVPLSYTIAQLTPPRRTFLNFASNHEQLKIK